MKNLLKGTLGVVAATVVLAVLASAAIAATPTLSPVPTKCTGSCSSYGELGSGGGGIGNWSQEGVSWKWTGLSVPAGTRFESWNEGTELRGLKLTFENSKCTNEGFNFTTNPLRGRLAVVEGVPAVLLEPETGSTIGKCSYSGSSMELTGSYVAGAATTAGKLRLTFEGQGLGRLTPLEPEHVITSSTEGGPAAKVSWTGVTELAAAPELHYAGRTSTFATPWYEGGFVLSGSVMSFQSQGGIAVKCKYTSGAGQFTSATGGYVYLYFKSCTGPLLSPCTGWEGLRELKVQLAYTYPATETPEGRQTALVLSPESGELINEFECGGVKFANRGAVMAVVSPLGRASSTFALTMNQSKGIEEHTEYEGLTEPLLAELMDSNEGGKWEESGLGVKTPSIYLNAGGVETIK